MMMEAMRLSLLEHEAQQRREAEERARNEDSSNSRPRAESRNSTSSPPNAEGTDTASPTVLPTLTTPTFDVSPASSSTPNLTTVSLPAPQQLRENPPNGPSNHDPVQDTSSSYAVPRHPPLSRMDSLASSVATHETSAGDGYRFLPSESEESIVSREPLLHVEENDA